MAGKIGIPGVSGPGNKPLQPAQRSEDGAPPLPATPPRGSHPAGMPTGRPPSLGGSRPPLPRAHAFSGRHNAPPGFLREPAQSTSLDRPPNPHPGSQLTQLQAQAQTQALHAQSLLRPAQTNTGMSVGQKKDASVYPSTPLLSKYTSEETGAVFGTSVKYLNASERQAYKVTVQNGLLMDANGKPFDSRGASSAFGPNIGRAIFVMDQDGTLYASNHQTQGKFHHSSFLAGAPVAAAGELAVENGVMKEVSRRSGHYCPTKKQLDAFLSEVDKQGAPPMAVDEPKDVFTYIAD
jgi:hypothetical protein